MKWWQSIRNRIEQSRSATYRTLDGRVNVRGSSFSALSLSMQQEINQITEDFCLRNIKACYGSKLDTLDDVIKRSENLVPVILNNPLNVNRVRDMVGYRDILAGAAGSGGGGLSNSMWMSGVNGVDPAKANHVRPNLYISPSEAASIYSNGGLPNRIIQKKAKSLHGCVEITNYRLNQAQLEKVHEAMVRTNMVEEVSNVVRDSLVYGGGLLFPFFKDDTPLSMTMPIEQLVRFGIVKKNCINRFVPLDRYNAVHFPAYNPTASDFIKPKYFYIPFLGCDMHSSRIARIVPLPQPGYFGSMLFMGWCPSDMVSWIEAVMNYLNVMQVIPTLLNQLSILARTFNIDGPLATEGAMIMDEVTANQTIRVREASPLNPINLDVIGELKAIDRDFSQVPELTKLIRQDVAAKAGLKEASLFTIEKKGAMGGSSGGEFADTRESEHNMLQLMYNDLQEQLRPVAMLQVIDALGVDRDIIKALPFTKIHLGKHSAETIDQRTEAIKVMSKSAFDLIASGIPIPDAADLIDQMSGGLFRVDSELRKRLEERQEVMDIMEKEQHDAEVNQMNAQADSAMIVDNGTTTTSKKTTKSTNGAGHSYEDKLEQRKHEVIARGSGSGTNKQGIAKARNKGKKDS